MPYLGKPVAPLHTTSAHAAHVHISWPRSIAFRTLTLACGARNQENLIKELIHKYRLYNASEFTLSLMVKALHDHMHISYKNTRTKGIGAVSNQVWIRVSAHPVWLRTLSGVLHNTPVPPSLNLVPGICWSNTFPNLGIKVSSANNHKL